MGHGGAGRGQGRKPGRSLTKLEGIRIGCDYLNAAKTLTDQQSEKRAMAQARARKRRKDREKDIEEDHAVAGDPVAKARERARQRQAAIQDDPFDTLREFQKHLQNIPVPKRQELAQRKVPLEEEDDPALRFADASLVNRQLPLGEGNDPADDLIGDIRSQIAALGGGGMEDARGRADGAPRRPRGQRTTLEAKVAADATNTLGKTVTPRMVRSCAGEAREFLRQSKTS